MSQARLSREVRDLRQDPLPNVYFAFPPEDIFTWHFVIYGLDDPYSGGFYHGMLLFPTDYPFKPPCIMLLTPNGRFICKHRSCCRDWSPTFRSAELLLATIRLMLGGEEMASKRDKDFVDLDALPDSSLENMRLLAAASAQINLSNPEFCQLFPEIATGFSKRSDFTHFDEFIGNFHQNSNKYELRLSRCGLDAIKCEGLSVGLSQMFNVTKIDLWGNRIGDEGVKSLLLVLTQLPHLTEIDIGFNNIGKNGATAVISAIVDGCLDSQSNILGLDGTLLDSNSVLLSHLPVEVRSSSFERVLGYLRDLSYGSRFVFQHKVMLVGDQAVGKTSLYLTSHPMSAVFRQKQDFTAPPPLVVNIISEGSHIMIQWQDRSEVIQLSPACICEFSDNKNIKIIVSGANSTLKFQHQPKECLTQFVLAQQQSSVCNIELQFEDCTIATEWYTYISHWIDNKATEGIRTRFHEVAHDAKAIKLCWMDFAGQPELYSCHQHFLSNRTTFLVVWNIESPTGDRFYECLQAETRAVVPMPDAIKDKARFMNWAARLNCPISDIASLQQLERLFEGKCKFEISVDGVDLSSEHTAPYLFKFQYRDGIFSSEHYQPNGIEALEFWLNMVKPYLSGDSRKFNSLLIVGTHADQATDTPEERKQHILRVVRRVGIDITVEIKEISLYPTPIGIEELRTEIMAQILKLEHIESGENVPSSYLEIGNTIDVLCQERREANQHELCTLQELQERLPLVMNLRQSSGGVRSELLQRALLLLHEWGQCVYFDQEGINNILSLSMEFLSQQTLAKLFAPAEARRPDTASILTATELEAILRSFQFDDISYNALLKLMENLRFCFPLKDHATQDSAASLFLIPSRLPKTVQLDPSWLRNGNQFREEKQLVLYFNCPPPGLIGSIIAKIHDEQINLRASWDPSVCELWQEGIQFSTQNDCRIIIRLEQVPTPLKFGSFDGNLAVNWTSELHDQKLLSIRVASFEHESGCNLIQQLVKIIVNIFKEYPGLTLWKLSEICPFHHSDSSNVSCYVDLDSTPFKCLATGKSLDETQIKRVAYFSGVSHDGIAVPQLEDLRQDAETLFSIQKVCIENQVQSILRIKRAVCIGVNEYAAYCDFPVDDLAPSTYNDCNNIATNLTRLGFNCRILWDSTKTEILAAVSRMYSEAMQDHFVLLQRFPDALPPLLLFSFSGHGIQGPDGQQYFVPNFSDVARVTQTDIYDRSLSISVVSDILYLGHVFSFPVCYPEGIILADCCRCVLVQATPQDNRADWPHPGQMVAQATSGNRTAWGDDTGFFTRNFLTYLNSIECSGQLIQIVINKVNDRLATDARNQNIEQEAHFQSKRMRDFVFRPYDNVLMKTMEMFRLSSPTIQFNPDYVVDYFRQHPNKIREILSTPPVYPSLPL